MLKFLPFFLLLCSCFGSNSVTFTSPSALTISSLEQDGTETILGNTPLTIEGDKLFGKKVRASAKGFQDEYWVFLPTGSFSIEAVINPKQVSSDENLLSNRIIRLILESYQALVEERTDESRKLAAEASKLDSSLAGPLIIQALSLLKEGKNQEAKAILNRARILDPNDRKIQDLIKGIE